MALTNADKQLLIQMKADGLTKEQAIGELKKVKLKMLSPTVSAVAGQIDRAMPGVQESPAGNVLDVGVNAFKRFGSGTKEAARKALELAGETQESYKQGNIGKGELLAETVGEGVMFGFAPLAGLWEAISPAVEKGVEKSAEALETVTAPAVEVVQNLIGGENLAEMQSKIDESLNKNADKVQKWWADVPEDQKRQIAVVLGAGERILDVAGFGASAKGAKVATKTALEAGDMAATTGKQLLKEGIETVRPELQAGMDKIKNYLTKRQDTKRSQQLQKIQSDVETFLKSKVPLVRETERLAQQGTDVKKHLSNPVIFDGLKVENGKVVADEARDTIQNMIDTAMDAKKEILPFADKYLPKISREQLREKALAAMDELTPADARRLISKINQQVDELPEEINVSYLDNFRAQSRKSARNAKGEMKSDSEYVALEKAARELVFEATDGIPVDTNGAFAQLNQYIKELIDTKGFIEGRLSGQIVKSGKMTELLNRTTGAIAGSQFGVLGSVVGAEVAGILTNILANRQLGNTVKQNFLKKFLADKPELLKQVDEILADMAKYEPPALAAPTSDFRQQTKGETTIILPEKSEYLSNSRTTEFIGE